MSQVAIIGERLPEALSPKTRSIVPLKEYPNARVLVEVGMTTAQLEHTLALAGVPKQVRGTVLVDIYSQNVRVQVDGDGIIMTRQINTRTGVIYNAYFKIYGGGKDRYSGLDIFSGQVKQAQAAGYKKIRVDAAGEGQGTLKHEGGFNGYYTWLRFGYVPEGNDTRLKDTPEALMKYAGVTAYRKNPTLYSPNGKITGLMETAAGRELWVKYGKNWEGEFDLAKGSYSDKALRAYYKHKRGKAL